MDDVEAQPNADGQFAVPETPEDVAILYSWANMPGAKYRDFSASRREYRAQQRARMAEQQRQAELDAAKELEAAAQREFQEAERIREDSRRPEAGAVNFEQQTRSRERVRRAEEHALRERQEAQRKQQSAEMLRVQAQRARGEMLEARKRAEDQAARYAEAAAHYRDTVPDRTRGSVPGETTDPYYYTGQVDPAYFASTPGVRTAQATRISTERRAYVYPMHPGSDDHDSGTLQAYRSITFAPSPAQNFLPPRSAPRERREREEPSERVRMRGRMPEPAADEQQPQHDEYYDGKPPNPEPETPVESGLRSEDTQVVDREVVIHPVAMKPQDVASEPELLLEHELFVPPVTRPLTPPAVPPPVDVELSQAAIPAQGAESAGPLESEPDYRSVEEPQAPVPAPLPNPKPPIPSFLRESSSERLAALEVYSRDSKMFVLPPQEAFAENAGNHFAEGDSSLFREPTFDDADAQPSTEHSELLANAIPDRRVRTARQQATRSLKTYYRPSPRERQSFPAPAEESAEDRGDEPQRFVPPTTRRERSIPGGQPYARRNLPTRLQPPEPRAAAGSLRYNRNLERNKRRAEITEAFQRRRSSLQDEAQAGASARQADAERHPSDTLQQSRELVASRWLGLKDWMEPGHTHAMPVPTRSVPRADDVLTPALCVMSLSGGVGKTSIVATLARALSSSGEKVFLADTNENGLLPYYFGARGLAPGNVRTFTPPPGGPDEPVLLVSYDTEPARADDGQQSRILQDIGRRSGGFDRVIADLSASSAWLVQRLAAVSPWVLVPVAPDMNSVVTMHTVERVFSGITDRQGHPVRPYYVLNQYDPALPLHLDVREVLRRSLGERLLRIVLHRSALVAEALAEGMTVVDYAPGSPITEDYMNLANWIRNLAAPGAVMARAEARSYARKDPRSTAMQDTRSGLQRRGTR